MQITINDLATNADGGVVSVKWTMTASKDGVEIKDIGASKLAPNSFSSDFIPFNQLKESDVIEWVSKNINASAVEQRLNKSIAEQAPSSTSSFPWN
jgi:hypothetical protein